MTIDNVNFSLLCNCLESLALSVDGRKQLSFSISNTRIATVLYKAIPRICVIKHFVTPAHAFQKTFMGFVGLSCGSF